MRKKNYVGVKTKQGTVAYERFLSTEIPTFSTHGEQYNAVIGPFRTKVGALFLIHFGHANPHCQTVCDAERLSKDFAIDLKMLGDRKTIV